MVGNKGLSTQGNWLFARTSPIKSQVCPRGTFAGALASPERQKCTSSLTHSLTGPWKRWGAEEAAKIVGPDPLGATVTSRQDCFKRSPSSVLLLTARHVAAQRQAR